MNFIQTTAAQGNDPDSNPILDYWQDSGPVQNWFSYSGRNIALNICYFYWPMRFVTRSAGQLSMAPRSSFMPRWSPRVLIDSRVTVDQIERRKQSAISLEIGIPHYIVKNYILIKHYSLITWCQNSFLTRTKPEEYCIKRNISLIWTAIDEKRAGLVFHGVY